MANRVIGIDIDGRWVHTVELEVSFRDARVSQVSRRPVPPGEDPPAERAVAALLSASADRHYSGEHVLVAADDAATSARTMELPFHEKQKIEKTLPFQLEGTLPFNLDDMLRDHRVLERLPGGGARVLVAMAHRDAVEGTIRCCEAAGMEARAVLFAPAAYGSLVSRAYGAEHPPLMVLEVGHERTVMAAVIQGKVRFTRTMVRGVNDVEHEVAVALGCTEEEAAAVLKHRGEVLMPGAPEPGGDLGAMTHAVRKALGPLTTEIKRTLQAYRASGGPELQGLLLCGSGVELRGFERYLEACFGLQTQQLNPMARSGDTEADTPEGLDATPPAAYARAVALALAGTPGRGTAVPDLRQGDLAFRAATHFVRDRMLRVAAMAAALAVLWLVGAYARLSVIDAEEEALRERLAEVTTRITGKPIEDFEAARTEIAAGGGAGANPLPTATAYDILREMSARIPRDVVVDINELDIKSKKTFIKGQVDKAGDQDAIVAALKDWSDCFTEFKPGELRPTLDKKRKEFSLSITTTCP